ncbi:hypothetical protein evm_013447 [Chilo suppressalis]|nr:hypothetical protein evm_013447 [Chilo suppressalis]
MDKTTTLGSNTTVSSKKLAFSSAARELIVALVRDKPIIEDKSTHTKNIELKKLAWENLTVPYNSQPYVSQRVTHQLKRCWQNIKTQRKKELSQESLSLKRTGGGPPESSSTISNIYDVIVTICPFINLRVPGVIDSNSIELLADTKKPFYGKNQGSENENITVTDIDLSILEEQNDKHCNKSKILNTIRK